MPRRIYANHKERVRAYRERDRERHNAIRREWAKANPDKVRESAKRWYEANKDRLKDRPLSDERKEYYRQKARRRYLHIKADPEFRAKESARKRALRARRAGASGSHTAQDIRELH